MKNGYYEYKDLPNSYRGQANCSICDKLKLTDKKTDYNGKTKYFCKEHRQYIKLDNSICQDILISPSNYKRLGTYRPSGCYITTIVCEILGYPDDCDVLNTLRGFRDNYLKKNSEYLGLLLEYDYVGPVIAQKIRDEKNNFLLCEGLYDYFLIPCVDAIKNELYIEAVTIYKNMVDQLHDEFELPTYYIPENPSYDMETLGKGRIREIKSEF